MNRAERVRYVMMSVLEGVSLEGAVLCVDGDIGVRRALDATGLSRSDWSRFGEGATVIPPEERFDSVCMRLPKGRKSLVAMLHLVAERLHPTGRLWLYGANDEGIRSSKKTLKTLFRTVETIDTRKHCRVWEAREPLGPFTPLCDFMETVNATIGGRDFRFRTLPGVFAHGRVDVGTSLLLRHLTVRPHTRVLDFGCGAGVIGAFLCPDARGIRLHGLDIDAWALRCAQENTQGSYSLSDGWSAVSERFDHIVSNPPFHSGKDTDFRVLEDLVERAPEHLLEGGTLTFVCPVTAPVKSRLERVFRKVHMLGTDGRFRVWEASL